MPCRGLLSAILLSCDIKLSILIGLDQAAQRYRKSDLVNCLCRCGEMCLPSSMYKTSVCISSKTAYCVVGASQIASTKKPTCLNSNIIFCKIYFNNIDQIIQFFSTKCTTLAHEYNDRRCRLCRTRCYTRLRALLCTRSRLGRACGYTQATRIRTFYPTSCNFTVLIKPYLNRRMDPY